MKEQILLLIAGILLVVFNKQFGAVVADYRKKDANNFMFKYGGLIIGIGLILFSAMTIIGKYLEK